MPIDAESRRVAESGYVLDASALLCLLFGEPGADRVEAILPRARMGAANLAEVITKLADRGADVDVVVRDLAELDLEIVPLDRMQAELAGQFRVDTRKAGLSLGDRCCLALAATTGATALTADRAWDGLLNDVAVEFVR